MIYGTFKQMTISYDHRGLPVEFKRERSSDENGADSVRLVLNYDGAGSRISKIRERKSAGETEWTTELTTHYTGIGSEIREDALNNATKVVVNLPQSLGRYEIASASESSANTVPSFEWYLKNHLGSTMLVYGTQSISDPTVANLGSLKAAYDYRAFGEQVDLTRYTDKVTETFTGKEKDDETELSNHGARMLDPMLGVWIAVDPYREFYHSYAYSPANPINGFDSDGLKWIYIKTEYNHTYNVLNAMSRIVGEIIRVPGKIGTFAALSPESFIYSQRYLYHEWRTMPGEQPKWPEGTTRKLLQTYIEKDNARKDFYNRNPNQVGVPQLWTEAPFQWAPIMPECDTPEELNGNGYGVEYVPNGSVEAGDISEMIFTPSE